MKKTAGGTINDVDDDDHSIRPTLSAQTNIYGQKLKNKQAIKFELEFTKCDRLGEMQRISIQLTVNFTVG